MTLKSSRSLWFRSFCLGLNAAKWKQCADHRVGQTEGTQNLWSFTGVDLTTTVGPLWERGINSVNAIKTQWGVAGWGWTARSWLGKINFPVRNVMNCSPMSLCIPLSNPNIGVCPKLVSFVDCTPYSSSVRGGIRAKTVILTDIRLALNATLMSFKTYLGVKKVTWHVNNLQLQILFNTWISPCGWNRKPSKVENLINVAICMDWNDSSHVSLNHL